MLETGIYIEREGKLGDCKKGWGYVAFFGNQEQVQISKFSHLIYIKEFDGHLVLTKIKPDITQMSFREFEFDITKMFGIEPLDNIEKADERAYQEIKELATGIYAHLHKDTTVKIIDKTGNKKLESIIE